MTEIKFGQENKLSLQLIEMPPVGVALPKYKRADLSAGILHIGVGNFHRAHQGWYLDKLMSLGLGRDWAIVGAGVRTADQAQREKLSSQDYLTTLIELDPNAETIQIVAPMIDYVEVCSGHIALIERMSRPDIRITTLTITESGYFLHPATQDFDVEHPDIQRDIADPESPTTVFGAILEGLRRRRNNGVGPLTIQSCDNLRSNGDITKQVLLGLAAAIDDELKSWIQQTCSFPNSMVDCIVPATGDAEIELARRAGIGDLVPVTHENFRQWIIEDDFCAGRPDWEKVGVIFTENVRPYEDQKIRILNAGHQILCNAAELLGLITISEAMMHNSLRKYFDYALSTEIAVNVPDVPGMTSSDYVSLVTRRFENPKIRDTIRRVAFDGSSRHPGMVLPSIRVGLEVGTPIVGLALAEAAWSKMCAGERDDGSIIEPNDPHWDSLKATSRKARDNPLVWLEQKHIYGDLAKNELFSATFSNCLRMLWERGTEEALNTVFREN